MLREIDRSWRSLLDPGNAGDYFDFPVPQRARFAPFSIEAAQFLAELSRLTYQHQAASRREIVRRIGWMEVEFVERAHTQCGVYRSVQGDSSGAVVAVFRGTDSLPNWVGNLDARWSPWPWGGAVHRGFRQFFDAVWGAVDAALAAVGGRTVFAGHSLGGALAQLAGSAAGDGAVAVYSFGAPRVGDGAFCASLDRLPVYRVVNHLDLVTRLPPTVGRRPYLHAGQLVQIGSGESAVSTTIEDVLGAFAGRSTRSLTQVPRPLADHAPVNYVHQLPRAAAPVA